MKRYSSRQLVWATLVASGLLLVGCGSDSGSDSVAPPASGISYRHQPLNGATVRQFLSADQQLLIATTAGIYRKQDQQWQLMSAANWDVLDLERLGTSHYLATLELNGVPYLAETVSGGQNW